MEQPGLHGRHRDINGEVSRKHGNTLVSTLRKTYGDSFAHGFNGQAKLSDVLREVDGVSLSMLVEDHNNGILADKIGNASN